MLYPLKFQPVFKPYVWGGRNIGRMFGKPIPAEGPVAESWEIVDRRDENSVVANGPLKGKTLRWLMEHHGAELLGKVAAWKGRFPLLVKILDAREILSLQVHPPSAVAEKLGGEPKTEMWYVYEARPGASLYVGLKAGTTPEQFEAALKSNSVENCLHRADIRAGDAMFLPSGRLHAIGGHCVLFEIQQNSDTTYRVYDWGRVGTDGKPRPLHIAQALQCIDFTDFEPALATPHGSRLVECPWFVTERYEVTDTFRDRCADPSFQILCGLEGKADVVSETGTESLVPGDFVLLPASLSEYRIVAHPRAAFLKVYCPYQPATG